MRNAIASVILYTLFIFLGSHLFANEEKTFFLGGQAGWELAAEYEGVSEYEHIRPHRVLALSSSVSAGVEALDLAVSFDESSPAEFHDVTGNYTLETSASLSFVDRNMARHGNGAARFFGATANNNNSPLVITPANPNALLFQGQKAKDFSMSFWLYPMNAENGEQILSWLATRQTAPNESVFQRIQCIIVKNKLQWNFTNFFFSPDDRESLTLSISSSSVLIPKMWSHHLIRFDSDTGRMEYLVNGEIEHIVYASSSGKEGGDVYLPVSGNGGSLELGIRYTGLIDEFRTYTSYKEQAGMEKFAERGGSFRSKPMDMGTTNARIKKIDVSGGITSSESASMKNTFLGNNIHQFANNEALQFFVRTADNPYHWTHEDTGWFSFVPGTELPENTCGKWMQIMVNMYPGGGQESSPYIDEIKISYLEDNAPPPPTMLYAQARDGAVDLSWKASSGADIGGYLVYYGTESEVYFGESAILGVSPINAGISTSVHIDGLKNGTLYYFSVAAYDKAADPHIGEFSKEAAARPLKIMYPGSY